VDGLGACEASGTFGPRFAIATDGLTTVDCTVGGGATPAPCWCDGTAWVPLLAAGGTDDQVAAEVPFTPAGGVAAADVQAAIEEVDAEHTTDTGPSPDCAGTSTYQDGEGGCDTVGGDLSGGLDVLSLAADSVGLDELAACAGPDEIVEYGASGVPSCIATPSGGGGIGGSTGAVDNALLLADGAGGALLKSAGADFTFTDSRNRIFLQGDGTWPPDIQIYQSAASTGLKRWTIRNTGGSGNAVLEFGILNDGETAWTVQRLFRLRVDANGRYVDFGAGSTGAAILRPGTIATAPAACANGDQYTDTSGAFCICWSAAWVMVNDLSGTGSCA
jgi:hypothetical protein